MRIFAHWVITHRWHLLVTWLVVATAGVIAAPRAVDRLSYDFSLPGEPSTIATRTIEEQFAQGSPTPPLLIVATGDAAVADADAAAARARRVLPDAHLVRATGPLVSADRRTAVTLVYPVAVPGPDPYVVARPALVASLAQGTWHGHVAATDFLALSEGEAGSDRGLLIEIAIGATGALLILLLVFGSVLAIAPLIVAATSILGTFVALLGLTYLTDVSFIVQFLIALIGLGVAIDYSLLVVTRWREECAAGHDNATAVTEAVHHAGRAVLVSGMTVAISLAALVLAPAPFLRSVGVGGLLIPLFSVATSLTLLPALLSLLGTRLWWPRRRITSPRSRGWAAVGAFAVRRPWVTVALGAVTLGMCALPVSQLQLGSPRIDSVTGLRSDASEPFLAARQVLHAGIPAGVFRPIDVVVDSGDADAVHRAGELPGVALAVPATDDWRSGAVDRVAVVTSDDPASSSARAVLHDLRALVGPKRVAGSVAEDADFVSSTYVRGAWSLLLVVAATFLLLARAVRSLWLPIKALLLNVVSLAAAFGVTVFIWQEGHFTQTLFQVAPAGSITTWVPVAAFAFLFGLSMDYEVFILSRMRESWDAHGDNGRAIVDGIAHTGRLVTSAAAILVFAFIALATVPTVEVKILATTLAVGIAIDAVIVRSLLAPGLVALFGSLNWSLPGPLRTLLRVPPEPTTGPTGPSTASSTGVSRSES